MLDDERQMIIARQVSDLYEYQYPHTIFKCSNNWINMQDQESIWMYDPSFPLAVVGTVVYGIIFLAIAYLTLIKYRAWYFIVVVIGSAIEVAAYNLRIHSVQNQSEIVRWSFTVESLLISNEHGRRLLS